VPQLKSSSRATTVEAVSVRQHLRALRLLFRVELSSMVALSAFAGYLFAGGLWQIEAFLAAFGTGLLAAGCSALNQWQEQDVDQRMERTQSRPLVTGLFTPGLALILASFCLSGGILTLSLLPGQYPLLLGVLAIIWYNAIYTPLKRKTPFAAIPGAVCGALPPLIGWTAAGGILLTQKSLILAGTLFVWQIPHTWLLLCRYRNDLKQSGLPDLFTAIPTERLLRINNCWLMSLFLCYLLFPLFNYIKAPTLNVLFIVGLMVTFVGIYRTSQRSGNNSAGHSFHLVNISMALLLTVLILDRFFLF
jgi:heme o synthase